MRVSVVVTGDAPETLRRLEQTAVVSIHHGLGAMPQVLGNGVEAVWVLRGAARPEEAALARLVSALDDAPHAVLAAGLVVDRHGAPLEPLVPGVGGDVADAIPLVERGLLPVRWATLAHTLVRREAFIRHGLPREERYGRYAEAEWSARVLGEDAGYLVSGSRATQAVVTADGSRARALLVAMRMARTGTWTRGEAVGAFADAWCGSRPG